jgi:hydrogenase expression/formation protein HypE
MCADLPVCPSPHHDGDLILLAHGEGARLSRRLVRDLVLESLENEYLRPLADAATLPPIDGTLVFTTDSYVVSPLFFPGGDIGKLAVHGTINDLAVSAAEPLYLSLSLIVEEGLKMSTLRHVVQSFGQAARTCRVLVVTGDTKVVPRGAVDGLFVNAAGLGRLRPGIELGVKRVRPGDRILVSGTLADHGIAILAAREALDFEGDLKSDTAPLHELSAALLNACGAAVHFLRDPTRGGLSAALHELAEGAGQSILLEEAQLPLARPVRSACELLGLDPLYVANEGKLMAVVAAERLGAAIEALRQHPLGRAAAEIGIILPDPTPRVLVRGALGATRVLDEPSGAPLPRIC